jgi:rubrerythrin
MNKGKTKTTKVNLPQVHELLYQALETEVAGVGVYQTAIRCAVNADLKKEWQKYLDQTRRHVEIVEGLLAEFGLDPADRTPGREVVHRLGASLVAAMDLAREEATPEAAQLVAAECVVLAETKDHQNWELIGEVLKKLTGERARAMTEAQEEVEPEEDEHLYHTAGWARELWIQSLGLAAVLPPPEEVKKVETAIGASRAKQSRTEML